MCRVPTRQGSQSDAKAEGAKHVLPTALRRRLDRTVELRMKVTNARTTQTICISASVRVWKYTCALITVHTREV